MFAEVGFVPTAVSKKCFDNAVCVLQELSGSIFGVLFNTPPVPESESMFIAKQKNKNTNLFGTIKRSIRYVKDAVVSSLCDGRLVDDTSSPADIDTKNVNLSSNVLSSKNVHTAVMPWQAALEEECWNIGISCPSLDYMTILHLLHHVHFICARYIHLYPYTMVLLGLMQYYAILYDIQNIWYWHCLSMQTCDVEMLLLYPIWIYICKLSIALSLYLLLLCILYLYKIHSNIICPRTDICHADTKKSQFGSLTISPALVSFTDVMSKNLAGGQARAHAHAYVLSTLVSVKTVQMEVWEASLARLVQVCTKPHFHFLKLTIHSTNSI